MGQIPKDRPGAARGPARLAESQRIAVFAVSRAPVLGLAIQVFAVHLVQGVPGGFPARLTQRFVENDCDRAGKVEAAHGRRKHRDPEETVWKGFEEFFGKAMGLVAKDE